MASDGPCTGCGMRVSRRAFHPYAACMMFRESHDSRTVEANLRAVVEYGMAAERVGTSLDEAMRDLCAVPAISEHRRTQPKARKRSRADATPTKAPRAHTQDEEEPPMTPTTSQGTGERADWPEEMDYDPWDDDDDCCPTCHGEGWVEYRVDDVCRDEMVCRTCFGNGRATPTGRTDG